MNGAWCPSYLRGGVQRFHLPCHPRLGHPEQNLQFLCLCALVPLPGSSLYGLALSLFPAQERSSSSLLTLEGTLNQGRCCKTCPNGREVVGSFLLVSLISGIPVASLAPSRGCEAKSSTWEFPSHPPPKAGSSVDTATLEHQAQALETGRRLGGEIQRSRTVQTSQIL